MYDKSNIKVGTTPRPPLKELSLAPISGNFYIRKRDDGSSGLFFCASYNGAGQKFETEDRRNSTFVAVSGLNAGFALDGLYEGDGAYELVDVEIVVKPRG